MESGKRLFAPAAALAAVLGGGLLLLGPDAGYFLRWWAALAALGVAAWPLFSPLLRGFRAGGWLFVKVLGLAAAGWGVWLLASLRVLRFSRAACLLLTAALFAAGLLRAAFARGKGERAPGLSPARTELLRELLFSEAVFAAALVFWVYLRGFNPAMTVTTEKYMDFGLLKSILKTDYFPANDFWYTGAGLNYYYFGQYLSAFLTKLSGLEAEQGCNLTVSLMAALGFSLPAALVFELGEGGEARPGSARGIFRRVSAALAGVAVTLSASMHYPIYAWLLPLLEKGRTYYYWNSTRYIGYDPETLDKTINEMPAYSYIMGDMHAHMLDTALVFTVLALLFAWARRAAQERPLRPRQLTDALSPHVFVIGFLIGLMQMTNFWDYPIYLTVSFMVFGCMRWRQLGSFLSALGETAVQMAALAAVSVAAALPFTLNFKMSASSVYPTNISSPFYKLLVLWALPAAALLWWLGRSIAAYAGSRRREAALRDGAEPSGAQPEAAGRDIAASEASAAAPAGRGIAAFLGSLSRADLFVLLLGIGALGLVLIPELVYVKDIYGDEYKRANTMFKLNYQSYLLFGITSAYILPRLAARAKKLLPRLLAALLLLCFAATCYYGAYAIQYNFGDVLDRSRQLGVSAVTDDLARVHPDDLAAIEWINENLDDGSVILEANGDSYSYCGRISVFTGHPSVLQWFAHEWIWRADPDYSCPDDELVRAADVAAVYTSGSRETVLAVAEKYDIAYLYIGAMEWQRYPALTLELLLSCGETVFSVTGADCAECATYLIRLDRG